MQPEGAAQQVVKGFHCVWEFFGGAIDYQSPRTILSRPIRVKTFLKTIKSAPALDSPAMKQTIRIILLLLVIFGVCWLTAYAEKDYALTPDQAKQWAALSDFEKTQAGRHAQAILAAVNTPVGELSKEVHAAVQSMWLAASLARSQRAEWLAKLQAEQGIPNGQIVDGKLIKPKGP
jgi:hypothetical protein